MRNSWRNKKDIKTNPLLFLLQMFSSIVLTLCAQLLYDKISYAGMFTICGGFGIIGKGPSINYVVSVEGRDGVAQ